MLSAIVQKTTGMKVIDYLETRLFEPLGIENATWTESPQGITAGGIGAAPPILDSDVTAIHPSQLLKSLPKRRDASLPFRIIGNRHQHGKPLDPVRLSSEGQWSDYIKFMT
jgi:CubicO group peptidase (beta-lactamase class C family)